MLRRSRRQVHRPRAPATATQLCLHSRKQVHKRATAAAQLFLPVAVGGDSSSRSVSNCRRSESVLGTASCSKCSRSLPQRGRHSSRSGRRPPRMTSFALRHARDFFLFVCRSERRKSIRSGSTAHPSYTSRCTTFSRRCRRRRRCRNSALSSGRVAVAASLRAATSAHAPSGKAAEARKPPQLRPLCLQFYQLCAPVGRAAQRWGRTAASQALRARTSCKRRHQARKP